MKIKLNKKNAIVIAALAVIMLIGGVAAYFTSTDSATNTWTVGKVEIDLQEPEYDKVPDERKDITPNKQMTKDPKVQNTGINDAFVFVRFSVPKANVKVANQDGTAQPASLQELFLYDITPGWTQVSKTEGDTENTYIYAYGTTTACTRLVAGAITPILFKDSHITFKNVVEGQGLEESDLELPIEAFGIQADDLGQTDAVAPAAVWKILNTQVESNN